MEAVFKLELVDKFTDSVRKQGLQLLSPDLFASLSSQQLSTPLLAWIFSHRKNLEIINISELIKYDLERQKTKIGHNILKEKILRKYPEKEKTLNQAFYIINNSWKNFFELIENINPLVSLQTNDRKQFESESESKAFGQIIFNMKSDCPVHWAEIIVHEIAHHYLNVILATKPMSPGLKNKFKEERYSFQRKSPRPLIGIFHGVFAQTCMLIYTAKVQVSSLDKKVKSDAMKTYHRYGEIFRNDLETIENEKIFVHYHELTDFVLQAKESVDYLKELEINE